MPRGAVISISHGGGPMPVLGDPGHAQLVQSLREKVPALLRLGTPSAPRAIVVVTAHWSAAQPTVSSAAKHGLLYDYGGFPREAYSLTYPAPGEPEVAREVKRVLDEVGLETVLDGERGGLFLFLISGLLLFFSIFFPSLLLPTCLSTCYLHVYIHIYIYMFLGYRGEEFKLTNTPRLGPRRLHPLPPHQPSRRHPHRAALRPTQRRPGRAPPDGPGARSAARLQRGDCGLRVRVVPQPAAHVCAHVGRRR